MVVVGTPLSALPDSSQWVGVIGARRGSLALRAQAFHLGATLARHGDSGDEPKRKCPISDALRASSSAEILAPPLQIT